MKKEVADAMSLQEFVDYIMGKLVEQGEMCYDSDTDSCAYGDGTGKHCAIGWGLDEDNKPLMTSESGVHCLVVHNQSLLKEGLGIPLPKHLCNHIDLFILLQEFHDNLATKTC